MLVLSLDTSCLRGSLALGRLDPGFQILAESSWAREKSHSELVTVCLMELLANSQKNLTDLNAIAVGIGPGSFTGLRVGLNVARTLGYSLGIPLWPVNSQRIWAEPLLDDPRPVLVLVNAFRNLLYVGLYQRRGGITTELWAPRALTVEETVAELPGGEVQVAGDGWATFFDFWPEEFKARATVSAVQWPEAKDLFPIMVEGSPHRLNLSWDSVKPLYIRGSEAEEKLRRGLLKPLAKV